MPSHRRALLVIDVQNEYVTGNLPIEYPAIRHSLTNICRAMDAALLADVPVIVVQNTLPAGAPVFSKGSPGWELHPSVRSRPYSHYIEKTLPSAFAGTDLAGWLSRNDIDTLVVVGYMTHNCADSTIKHALHAGLAVEFLTDAAGSLPYDNHAGRATAEEIHRVFTVVLQSRFAAVATTDEWIEALKTGKALPRDNIYGSNQRARGLRDTS
ncbi:cysteine hydrolase family protein [Ferrovum myxofaciens]|uniref:cysteine hydrolase family protein n=1 Tax=Ferrovum myxofaciens TaxID=416213 RepID=UPI002352B3DC|nr:cysteine hydrolase family protein [Ferrovum myxofaciens]MBU6993520.1 cysteine hydrolase [Ferrovum myxofaciens]